MSKSKCIRIIGTVAAFAAAPWLGSSFNPSLRGPVGIALASPQGAGAADQASQAEGKILYYQDPMHHWFHSDKPGIAPDCGMKLVPV